MYSLARRAYHAILFCEQQLVERERADVVLRKSRSRASGRRWRSWAREGGDTIRSDYSAENTKKPKKSIDKFFLILLPVWHVLFLDLYQNQRDREEKPRERAIGIW